MNKLETELLEMVANTSRLIMPNRHITITDIQTMQITYSTLPMRIMMRCKNINVEGLKFSELPSKVTEFAYQYRELTMQSLKRGQTVSALINHDFLGNGEKQIRQLDKQLIINPVNQKIIGLIDEVKEFEASSNLLKIFKYFQYRFDKNFSPTIYPDTNLPKRQYEILFLLVLGKSPKSIADFISKVENCSIKATSIMSTVNQYLYPRFNVNSMDQLIEKAILTGAINNIPKSFLDKKEGVILEL